MQRKNAFGLKYPKVYIDLGTKSTASERHRSGVRQDTCLKVLYVGVFSLTCSVDHALGCCCRSGKNVWCAASSGCSTRSGRAHRVDWQAARRRLFDRNHNAPVTNETRGHQPACEHKIPNQMLSVISWLCVLVRVHHTEQLRGWMYRYSRWKHRVSEHFYCCFTPL